MLLAFAEHFRRPQARVLTQLFAHFVCFGYKNLGLAKL